MNSLQLDTLTAEQEALCETVADEYIARLTKPKELDVSAVHRWLDVAYGLYDLKRPARVEIVDSPFAALKLSSELLGSKQTELDWCGISEGGWVSSYDYFNRIGVATDAGRDRRSRGPARVRGDGVGFGVARRVRHRRTTPQASVSR